MQSAPFIDAETIRAGTFVEHIEVHETLDSTNDRAVELARDANIELPALVVARYQTAGRGRGHNKWWSTDGGLTFSVLLEPAALGIATANWPQLSLAVAVAICDAIQMESASRVAVKWPNDVMLDGRKIAGILIESPGGAAPAKNRLIVGIGININNSLGGAPSHVAQNGIALCDVTGRTHDLQSVLTKVLNAIVVRAAQLRAHHPTLMQAWQRLNQLAEQNVIIETDGRRIEGKCGEIAADGALVVQTASQQQRFYSGSVRLK